MIIDVINPVLSFGKSLLRTLGRTQGPCGTPEDVAVRPHSEEEKIYIGEVGIRFIYCMDLNVRDRATKPAAICRRSVAYTSIIRTCESVILSSAVRCILKSSKHSSRARRRSHVTLRKLDPIVLGVERLRARYGRHRIRRSLQGGNRDYDRREFQARFRLQEEQPTRELA